MKKCVGFCANECINGHCPKALSQSIDWYEDAGYDVPKSCKSCWNWTGKCEDCIFEHSTECIEFENKNE